MTSGRDSKNLQAYGTTQTNVHFRRSGYPAAVLFQPLDVQNQFVVADHLHLGGRVGGGGLADTGRWQL